jgi:hypothetical protein
MRSFVLLGICEQISFSEEDEFAVILSHNPFQSTSLPGELIESQE